MMGTRADYEITPLLSMRVDLHGGRADFAGPVQFSMEHNAEAGRHGTASVLLRTELTREQAGLLKARLDEALERWDERERSGDGDAS